MAENIGLTDDLWVALLARQDRPGLYAVVTTGIACRFGCKSRPPLRGNVRLFETIDLAEAAGFRACKRCGAQAPSRSARVGIPSSGNR